MKTLLLGFYESVNRFLVPKLIAEKEIVYVVHSLSATVNVLDKERIDCIIVDIDNCPFDVLNFMSTSKYKDINWIFYSYQHDEEFLHLIKEHGVKGFLSKNIHPDYLFIKIMSILKNNDHFFDVHRRKYYRVQIEPGERARVEFYIPTIKKPIICKPKQLSVIGMQVILFKPNDIVFFREGQYFSNVTLKLNGYRLKLTGKVLKIVDNNIVLLFDKMDNYSREHLIKYIYQKMDVYLKELAKMEKMEKREKVLVG
jgi:DNA-binding response OmpR family regulator